MVNHVVYIVYHVSFFLFSLNPLSPPFYLSSALARLYCCVVLRCVVLWCGVSGLLSKLHEEGKMSML